MTNRTLNEAQVAVLEWIKDGCPDGVFTSGYSHRVTARALEARGLVKIRGRGVTWHAEPTDAGRIWSRPTADAQRQGRQDQRRTPMSARARKPEPDARDASGLEPALLLADVIAADGTLKLPEGVDIDEYKTAVKASLRSPSRPHGKRLELVRAGDYMSQQFEVRTTDYFEDHVDPIAVQVPIRVGKYHPAVRTFVDHRPHIATTRQVRPRAARVLEGLVRALVETGASVEPEATRTSHPGIRANAYRLAATTTGGHHFTIHICERLHRVTRQIPESKRAYSWSPAREYEDVATGELIVGVAPIRDATTAHTVRDGKRTQVEDRLGDLVRTIQIESLYIDQRAARAERERLERQRRWEDAMSRARDDYRTDYRRRHLSALADRWAEATRIRDFASAMRAQRDQVAPDQLPDVDTALAQAFALADELDPTQHPETVPRDVPEPRPEDLKPFLNTISPYGPYRS